MIEFVLDIISDLSLAITSYKTSDHRDKDIRAFIAFHDSIKEIDFKSEQFIAVLEEYINSYPAKFDLSVLRRSIRDFSLSTYSLAVKFREFGFKGFGTPFEWFSQELAESFVTVGSINQVFCRSLVEISTPDICFDKSLPVIDQRYFLRVLDYQFYNFSLEEVQKQWNTLFVNCGFPNLLWQNKPFPMRLTDSGNQWMSEVKTYDAYKHQTPIIFRRDEVQMNESFIRSVFKFKILSFTNIDEFKNQIQKDRISLQRLRDNRNILEEFLSTHFSMSDFF